ncbi:MAG: hypothetical protein K6U04_11390 [Armatimonadetes bacterium]|nr:hypothetical protein [Armatimonadota bacterium]
MPWYARGLCWGGVVVMVLLLAGGAYQFYITFQRTGSCALAGQRAVQAVVKLGLVFWPLALAVVLCTLALAWWRRGGE